MNLEDALQQLFLQIERVVRDAYRQGEADAIDRLVRAARSSGEKTEMRLDDEPARSQPTTNEVRRRAPKGAVEVLVDRALGRRSDLTPAQIKDYAVGDHERMIAIPSIRSHLRRTKGKYAETGGRWRLSEQPETDEAAAPAGGQAASDSLV